MITDEQIEYVIQESGGHWADDEFRINGKDLMTMCKAIAQTPSQPAQAGETSEQMRERLSPKVLAMLDAPTELIGPAPVLDGERAAQKAWREISAQMYARMSPFQFYYAGWVAARAASPQATKGDARAADKCFAADGKTATHVVHDLGVVVLAKDFNALWQATQPAPTRAHRQSEDDA